MPRNPRSSCTSIFGDTFDTFGKKSVGFRQLELEQHRPYLPLSLVGSNRTARCQKWATIRDEILLYLEMLLSKSRASDTIAQGCWRIRG